MENKSLYEKEYDETINKEINLISLPEAILKDDIEIEKLNKIKYFLTNGYINPYSFQVDINNVIFYNTETNQVYEVIKDENTNTYEIKEREPILTKYSSETAEMTNDLRMSNHKVRIRKKEDPPYRGNAAFTKLGFLVINIISFILLITMAMLLRK